jgi:hypothetical protein
MHARFNKDEAILHEIKPHCMEWRDTIVGGGIVFTETMQMMQSSATELVWGVTY